MDDLDKLIKNKMNNEVWEIPEELDMSINNNLKNLDNRKVIKKRISKIAVAAALIAVLGTTTVLANTEQIKASISSVVAFFNADKDFKYLSDKATFDKFNVGVGISTEAQGIKLTIDSIAVDDNFLNIFYTIENDKKIEKKGNETPWAANFTSPIFEYKLNGKYIEWANHNDTDAYFVSDNVIKGMKRENISLMNLPEEFKLEVFTKEIFDTKGKWYLSTKVDKKEVAVESTTVTPKKDVEFNVKNIKHKVTIDKVSISPFGSQIVLSERLKNNHVFDNFAMFDDKGNSLDVLNTDVRENSIGKTTNSFEFIKANNDMKYVTIVPIDMADDTQENNPVKEIIKDINQKDLRFDLSDKGSIIVDKVEIKDNVVKINYRKEGITLFDPDFMMYGADGKQFETGDGECYSDNSVDRQSGTYTQTLTYTKNVDLSKIKKIGTFSNVEFKLLKDQEAKIQLKE
jgi:hypothetical protein